MRLAVYGGTFDPPHLGHVKLAEEIVKNHVADKVLFVPAFSPPHKNSVPVTAFADRLKMLELALEGYGEFEISLVEQRFNLVPSYSLQTMRLLAGERPEDEIALLIGGDSLRQLHSWHRAAELVREFDIIIYPRPGEKAGREELERFWERQTVEKLLSKVVSLPFFEISSTEIRKKIAKNENVDKLIDSKVKSYIEKKGLYKDRI